MKHWQINPDFDSPELRQYINQLPQSFERDGKVIYHGRNTLKATKIGDRELIVKRFHRYSVMRALLNLFHPSKAAKAYYYGRQFLLCGINTPIPVASVEVRNAGMLSDTYFISTPLYAPDMRTLRNRDFDVDEVEALAKFLYEVHERGILHGDLNLTNILRVDSSATDPVRRYALIDTNRSRIMSKGHQISLAARTKNLVRVSHRRDLLRTLLKSYPLPLSCRYLFRELFVMEKRKDFWHALAKKVGLRK